jgi:F-type H+-transporting ATPase subunit b
MPQLDPSIVASQLFWLAVCFGVLYWASAKRILPALQEILESRRVKLATELDRAEAMKREAQDAQRQYEAGLVRSRAEANALLAEANEQIAKMAAERHKKLDETLADQMRESEHRLKDQRAQMQAQVVKVAEGIAQEVVRHLTGSAPTEAQLRASVEKVSHALVARG